VFQTLQREEAELRKMEETLRHRVANARKRKDELQAEPSTVAPVKSRRPRRKCPKNRKKRPEEEEGPRPPKGHRHKHARFLRLGALKEVCLVT
jgi:hypothetical protein